MAVLRVTVKWSGFTGAPGYTNFHFDPGVVTTGEALETVQKVRTFFEAIKGHFSQPLVIQYPTVLEYFDEITGELLGTTATPLLTTTAGTGAGAHAGPAGAVVSWSTNTLRNGRRIRGRTFLVPLAAATYDTVGTLTSTFVTAAQAAASALRTDIAGHPLVIWSRPVLGAGGMKAPVTSVNVPDLAAVLRSRRD